MPGPWEKYGTAPAAAAAPWVKYGGDRSATEPQPEIGMTDYAKDMAKSLGIGVANAGVGLAGLPGDVQRLARAGADYFDPQHKLFAPEDKSLLLPGSSDVRKSVEGYTGEFYRPKTTAGKYAETIGEFLPGGFAKKAVDIPMRLASRALLPAVGSEAAGQLAEGTAAEPYARVVGALTGAGIPKLAGRIVTPLPVAGERSRLVDVLRNEGVTDLTAGQRTGSRPLQWLESSLGDMPFSGKAASRMTENQGEQFTAAALKRAGVGAPRATAETVDHAFSRIGGEFDRLAASNTLFYDPAMKKEIGAAVRDYNSTVGASQRAPIIGEILQDIEGETKKFDRAGMTGRQYQDYRSRLDKMARSARSGQNGDPRLAEALSGIRGALDDAMERSIVKNNPGDLGAWRDARRQYRNMLAVEKAATGPGAATAEGLISPSRLRSAIVGQGRRAYARGQGDFAELARAGEAIMKPLPQSGTAPRSLPALLAGIGAGAGNLPAAAAMYAGPGVASRVLMSRPVQGYLGNQLLARPLQSMDTRNAALVAALLGSNSSPVRQAILQ